MIQMKKTPLILGVLLTVLIGGLFFLTKDTKPPMNIKNKTIVAFGDSLVAGYGATDDNDFVTVLSQSISIPIINLGQNGDTTATALSRIDTVLALNPGIVILLIGGNDILRGVPIDTTRTTIKTMLEIFDEQDVQVVLVGVRGKIVNDPYGPMYKDLADIYKAKYVPNILGGLIGNTTYMSDAIHPNDAGYAKIAEKVQKVLIPLLR